ncbi:MAG TPA: hypothetical protein DD670_04565 [Planctomycetaceae bacterium]|nr:hypothetical protein [Planctomycetaceae bacterium]
MSNWPFRFLHASDFHLETPPFGVDEVPDHLMELFLAAPYRSAERVFDAALAENVDFVVLAGDLLDSRRTGPRGPLFLVEQFERLAQRDIRVYWAGGQIDPPEAWPPSMRLPKNVYLFAQGEPEQRVHRRADTAVARLIGASRLPQGRIKPQAFDPEHSGVFSIAVAHGRADLESIKASRVDYWALGGHHSRRTLCESMPTAHEPGSPQGRWPEEAGPHGYTLIDVDLERNVELKPASADVLRWETQRLVIGEEHTADGLEREMAGRVESLRQASPETDFLITWHVAGSGPLADALRRGTASGELLARLRDRFGQRRPAAWSVAVSVEPPARHRAAWYDEDTIRGEFLRQIERLSRESNESLDLEGFLSDASADGPARDLLLKTPEASRTNLLREAAALGVDLLFGEEAGS